MDPMEDITAGRMGDQQVYPLRVLPSGGISASPSQPRPLPGGI